MSSRPSSRSPPCRLAASVALVGFGVDSGVKVISAVGLLWRLCAAVPQAEVAEESAAGKRALFVVASTSCWPPTSFTTR